MSDRNSVLAEQAKLKNKYMRLKEGVPEIRLGEEYQAIRYPIYKPDTMSWGFNYAEAESYVLKAKLVWDPKVESALTEDYLKKARELVQQQLKSSSQPKEAFWHIVETQKKDD